MGRRDSDGRGHHRRGRFRRPHRQPAGHRAVAHDACAARADAGPALATRFRPGSVPPAESPRLGRPRRRWRWGRPTSSPARSTSRASKPGTSDAVRRMLAQAQQADIAMAPAADMFEMGVKVQVLKRGTLFAMRAAKLYELYRAHESLDRFPKPSGPIWKRPSSVPRSRRSGSRPRTSSRSEIRRESNAPSAIPSRRWPWFSAGTWECRRNGPTREIRRGRSTTRSGAARRWRHSTTGCAGTFLEHPENRRVATVALNILYGAAVLTRAPDREHAGRCLARGRAAARSPGGRRD